MITDGFKAFIEEKLSGRSLVILSNREPYQHKKSGASIRVEKPAGGLTSAMDEALKAIGGTWVAWGSGSKDRDVVDERNRVAVPPDKATYTLKRVWLNDEEISNYYHGYSNQVLWPLCHLAMDRIFFRKKYWDSYEKANRAFADAVLEEADDTSIVWIHDYHMCLVPKLLRQERPGLMIAHFWHIPWPNYSVLRVCPQADELFSALLSNDLLGFQTLLFVHNFMECVRESPLEAEVDYENETITYKGHTTKLQAFPISVDFYKFHTYASSAKTVKTMERIKGKYALDGIKIGIGVDRLEYTKGLIKRFQAIDLFFEHFPEYRGKFTFIQIAVPTRMKEPYVSYKKNVEGLVKKINTKYALNGWNPIVYRGTKSEHEDLAAYYRMSDVAIISSIYDGMNLVAKEFIASQTDNRGVLLLSEFTGAAEELEGAFLVNPYDTEDFSECIKRVLDLPEDEILCRINNMRRQVKEKDIYHWIADFLEEASVLQPGQTKKRPYILDCFDEVSFDNIFLFLDYDGTLTPIVDSPELAVLADDMHSLIAGLREIMPVAVISGRSLTNVMDMVNISDMLYAGNHGSEIWDGSKLIVMGDELSESKQVLGEIIAELKNYFSPIKGAIIEDKGITASIHYRMVAEKDLCKMFDLFWSTTDSYKGLFRITSGKKVFEIRPRGIWHKGDAVTWIWNKFGENRIPVYIGDDTTDEDAYKAIKGKGIGISVGSNNRSDYYLKAQNEVKTLLQRLGGLRN
jgi:alpha,alpha-trehalose-phosphate synthase [UDP-forming]/trehalose-phosphatase